MHTDVSNLHIYQNKNKIGRADFAMLRFKTASLFLSLYG